MLPEFSKITLPAGAVGVTATLTPTETLTITNVGRGSRPWRASLTSSTGGRLNEVVNHLPWRGLAGIGDHEVVYMFGTLKAAKVEMVEAVRLLHVTP